MTDNIPTPAEAARMLQEAGAYAPRDDRERQILAENMRKIKEAETLRMLEAKSKELERQALPCPFCGNRADRRSENTGDHCANAYEVPYKCGSCGFCFGVQTAFMPGYAGNSTVEERALAAWNRRVEQKGGAA